MEWEWSDLENPVFRNMFLEEASGEDLKQLDDQFRGGNWSVFGAWATAVLQGELKPEVRDGGSAHISLVRNILKDRDRDKRLRFLLRAQMANRAIKDHMYRMVDSEVTDGDRKLVMDYLGSHGPDELPDERLISLAGLLDLRETISALGGFLEVKRKFFHRTMDVPHVPEEQRTHFRESLLSLLRMALNGSDEAKEEIGRAYAHTAEEEMVDWVEHHHDMHDGSVHVAEEEKPLTGGIRTKKGWLTKALGALREEGGLNEFMDIFELEPFKWVRKGVDGFAIIDGSRVYHWGNFRILSIDSETGRTHFCLDMGGSGMRCYMEELMITRDGPAILLNVDRGAAGKTHLFIILDDETGEVRRSWEPAFEPQSKLKCWAQGDGVVFFDMGSERLWLQHLEGELMWERSVPKFSRMDHRGIRIGILSDNVFQVVNVKDGEILLEAGGLDETLHISTDIRDVLAGERDRWYLFEGGVSPISVDEKGKVRWFKTGKDSGGKLEGKTPLRRGGYLGMGTKGLVRIDENGVMELIPHKLGGPVLCGEKLSMSVRDRMLVLYDGDFIEHELPVSVHDHIKLLDISQERGALRYYKDGWWLCQVGQESRMEKPQQEIPVLRSQVRCDCENLINFDVKVCPHCGREN